MSRPISKSLNYTWKSSGDEGNPRIAFIASSNALSQEIIKKRIQLLVDKGFCVSYPVYKSTVDGEESFLVDPVIPHEATERIAGSITPAVSGIDGATQVIEAIEAGIDIMPLMGGENFEKKIPHILAYFAEHPKKKNMAVRFFGLSNATFANYLAAEGICSFVSTPFLSVVSDSDAGKTAYDGIAHALLRLMKKEPGKCDRKFRVLSGEIAEVSTTHYPLNIGPFIDAGEMKEVTTGFNPAGNYSFEFEGFIEGGNRRKVLNVAWMAEKFLEAHKDNPPKFMVCALFSTRFDGAKGYGKLFHDDDGFIVLSKENIATIFAKKDDLKRDLADAIKDNGEKRKVEFSPDLTAKIKNPNYTFTEEDIVELIKHENSKIAQIHGELKVVADKYQIPLLLSTDFGHAANMGIVPCGDCTFRSKGKEVVGSFDLTPRPAKDVVAAEGKQAETKKAAETTVATV